MNKSRTAGIASIIIMTALLGVGCTTSTPKETKTDAVSESSNQNAAKYKFNEAISLEMPDEGSKATNNEVQSIVEDVFGKTKITSFLQNFPSKNSMSAEYTANRTITAADINALVKAVKDAGYTVEANGIEEGTAALIAHDDKYTLMMTFQVGEQKIAAIIGPQDQLPYEDTENTSS